MNALPVVHTAITQVNAPPLAEHDITALVAEIAAMPYLDETTQTLLAVFQNNYRWHSEHNKQQVMILLRALLTAHRHAFDHQENLIVERVLNLAAQDQAASVQSLVFHHLNYQGLAYCVPDDEPIPYYGFRVPIRSTFSDLLAAFSLDGSEYEWQFEPIHSWDKSIPPHALLAIELLDQHHITPQDFWVADKLRVRRYERSSVDPVLCVRFLRHFVGIAEWL